MIYGFGVVGFMVYGFMVYGLWFMVEGLWFRRVEVEGLVGDGVDGLEYASAGGDLAGKARQLLFIRVHGTLAVV